MTDEQRFMVERLRHMQLETCREAAEMIESLANPSDKQEADGVAVTSSGAEYHNPRKAYAEAEEAGCVRMWLDDLGAPIGDDAGTFSLVGRIRAHFANPSDKQEAVALKDQIIGDLQSAFDSELITENDSGDELVRLSAAIACVEDAFAAPLAQSAEQDRIDAERYRKWVSYSGFTKEHCDATLDPIKINEHAAKGASK